MVSWLSSLWLTVPLRPASLAINVIDRVLTTPYMSHTSSQAQ